MVADGGVEEDPQRLRARVLQRQRQLPVLPLVPVGGKPIRPGGQREVDRQRARVRLGQRTLVEGKTQIVGTRLQ